MKEIPVYIVEIEEEDEGVNKVSLVENPAFEQHFVYYATIDNCEIIDIEKRIIFAPIILSDYPVLRDQAPFGMHYAYYTPSTIEKIVNKYHKEKNTDKVNIHHKTDVDGVYMVQSFIKDSAKGINPKEFPEANDGSWFGAWRVDNDEIWNGIKDGTFNGPSMEIVHSYRDSGQTLELMFNTNYNSMSKKLNAVDRFKRRQAFSSAYSEVKGTRPSSSKYGSMWTSAGELAVDGEFEAGKEVFLYADGNEPIIAPDGTYTVTDGDMEGYNIVVSGGVIESISDPNQTDTEMEVDVTPVDESGTPGESVVNHVDQIEELALAVLEELQEVKDITSEFSKVEVVTKAEFNALYSMVEGIAKAIKMPVDTPAPQTNGNYQAPLPVDTSGMTPRERADHRLTQAALYNRK